MMLSYGSLKLFLQEGKTITAPESIFWVIYSFPHDIIITVFQVPI